MLATAGIQGVTDATTDQQLILRILDGDADGAAALIGRYEPALRRVLLHAGAPYDDLDDVLQETWIRMIRSASRYDPLQPFSRWLFAIAMNRLRTRFSHSSKDAAHESADALQDMPARTRRPAEEAESSQAARRIRDLVAGLPPRLAEAVLLRYFEELSEREVAAAIGIPLGTVKSRLHAAVARLKVDFEGSKS